MDNYMHGFYSYNFAGDSSLNTPDLQYLQRRSHEYAQYAQRLIQPPLPPPESAPPPPPPEPQQSRPSNQYRQSYGRLTSSSSSENGLKSQPPHLMHQSQNSMNRYNNRRYNSNHNRYNSSQNHHHNAHTNRHMNSVQNNYHSQSQNNYHGSTSNNHQQSSGRQELQLKRPVPPDDDVPSKRSRKKKKSLANSNLVLRHWSEEAAKLVLETEKELNGLDHQKQLIIKFPDDDLNRDIVMRFHSSITKVHFQHPSTPRYCFITLDEESDPDQVIKVLNKTPFGHGFLTAERKNPREEKVTDPREVDVCSLFVGNLPNHIKHAEVYQLYPESRRIDIGYAAVQRYKRYAFVHFYTPEEALAAYKRTFNRNSSSNSSMVVRFRRVNGSASVPNEKKVQNPPKSRQGVDSLGKDHDYEDEEEDLEEEEEEEHCEERVQCPVDAKNTENEKKSKEKTVTDEENPVRSLELLLQNQPVDEIPKIPPAPETPSEENGTLLSTVRIKEEPQDEPAEENEVEELSPWIPVIPDKEPKTEPIEPLITSNVNTTDNINVPVKREIDEQLSEYFRACAAYETNNTSMDYLLQAGNLPPSLCDSGDNLFADISNTLSKSIDHVIKQGPASGLVDKQLPD